MRVLVTGGAGFIGSHTVDHLLERGYDVRILDSLQPRVHPLGRPDYLDPAAQLLIGDASDREDLSRALAGVDCVIHLAAYQDYLPDFSRFIHVNTESAALIFELILEKRLPVQKIIFASSQSVAGEGLYRCVDHDVVAPEPRPVEQLESADWEVHCPYCGSRMESLLIPETVCSPHTAYAISKHGVEQLAHSLGKRYAIATASMRYTYVQGTRNSFFNPYSGICRIFALRIAHGMRPICFEDGRQLRDYVNVRDVARANVLALESGVDGHRVYNVGGGTAITVAEFAAIMLRVAGSSLEPETPGQFRIGDTRHTISDITAARSLGWEPEISVEQSVEEYLDWMSRFEGTEQYLREADRVMHQRGVIRSVKLAS